MAAAAHPSTHGSPDDASIIPSDQRTPVMLCHILSLCGYVIPFGNILGPLVIWLTKKDESTHVDRAGRESINFQITLLLYYAIGVLLLLLAVGICVLIALPIFHLVVVIVATIKATDGKHFRYPATIRFL